MYSVAFWAPIVARLIVAEYPDIPPAYAMRWLEMESDGNPCAIGSPHEFGPDGNPREVGLGQLYNPDDAAALGVSVASLRAYCVAGTQLTSRSLTNEEQDNQVRYTLLAKIAQGMKTAESLLGGLNWSTCDYFSVVKAPHALPAILGRGWPAVIVKLGRHPTSWAEFRTVLGMDHNEQWKHALDACEHCGMSLA